MDDLSKKQDVLQKEALKQIDELQLGKVLSPFGEVVIVGSVATGLMTWPDIDIEVIGGKFPSKKDFSNLKKALSTKGVSDVSFIDNRDSAASHLPAGLYMGCKRQVGTAIWKIDMWFIEANSQKSARKDIFWIMDALTPEKKKIILSIKSQISHNPKYRKSIFSTDIYKAVFEEGISSFDEFEEYLRKSGRSLT